ncbi:MAG: histidinol-phosphate transaminase [Clostridia bacterium]|nr:histidinol-phosphate transaminase [Clostridia bacterium]
MSRFFDKRFSELEAYTPGEQPRDMKYVKLNTNESPYPPSPGVIKAMAERELSERMRLYPDPECLAVRESLAALLGVGKDELVLTNGSDESLAFAFMSFCERGVIFPEISYGFYKVFAQLYGLNYRQIPLKDDFTIDPDDYIGTDETVFIANPNAPTGLFMPLCDIERIAASNPDRLVVIDEAYVDFGGESAIPLTKKYDNLLVIQTFSKSRSMAGARLGFAVGCADIIRDMNTIRYSTNPYNINSATLAMASAAVADNDYYLDNCKKIINTRTDTTEKLRALGFEVLDSKCNFIFAKHPLLDGEAYYKELKSRGVLVRHFGSEKIRDYNRITIGTPEMMDTLLKQTREILGAKRG